MSPYFYFTQNVILSKNRKYLTMNIGFPLYIPFQNKVLFVVY